MSDESTTTSPTDSPPTAAVRPVRRAPWWVWIIPIAALILAGFLASRHWFTQGPRITISFEEGHGLKQGDPLRCRGIDVGQVESITLNPGVDGVRVTAQLSPDAGHLAAAGTRFWIVRPNVSITEVSGLETITGPRYIAVLPPTPEANQPIDAPAPDAATSAAAQDPAEGDSGEPAPPADTEPQSVTEPVPFHHFVGLEEPPIMAFEPPGGLEVLLYGAQRQGLRRGAPVTYRQFRIGTIMSVGLSSDAGAVELRAYVRPAFRNLVRENTRFWATSGTGMKLGWTGLSFEMDSVASMLDGGVAMATPENAGQTVRTGHRFLLHDAPDDEWLNWTPALVVGDDALPAGAARPNLLRATTVRVIDGRIWDTTHRHTGWLLPVGDNLLLGPAEMLVARGTPDKRERQAELEVHGQKFDLVSQPRWTAHGLAAITLNLKVNTWPVARIRKPAAPQDALLFANGSEPPLPVAAARMTADGDNMWRIDRSITFEEVWHGAAVLSRRDGQLIGMLLVEKGRGTIALLPTEQLVQTAGK